ncbi:MAG: hypothetical protein KC800_21255, partial [Candidatus Eremiobacteraeota bacterium]|nr:hypothetical protein [Candidatus Eremiobacteraeota bacterium]
AEVTQGKDQQAARDLVSVIHFGSNFNGQGTLISDMIGIAIQAIGLNAFNGLIDLNSDFPAEEWKSLTKTILDSTPPKDSMIRAFQGEMVFCGNSVDGLADNAGDFQEDAWMTALPGFLGRELRIYNNLMSDQILSLQKNGSLNLPKELLEPTAMDRFTGRSGPLAEILIPSGERSIAHTNLSRRCLIAIATATGMAAYRAQEGKLPASLAQLSEAGIPVTDEKEWLEAMEYKVQGDTATLKIRVQDPPAELTPMSGTDWEHPWLEASNEFLVYKFEPLKK